MGCKLILISAPAGFGKTTLISEWIASSGRQAAWLSLDAGEGDPLRFLSYLVAALQTINAGIGQGLLAALQSSEPPGTEAVLTNLLNEITALPDNTRENSGKGSVLVLDDYHLVDSKPVDQAIAFLLEHQPPGMHLVIATREDPFLPLPRLRARGQCLELRAADLRFTPAEVTLFLNRVMGLNLSDADIAALEARTEGWIAGLQMAAISMQGHPDATSFIQSFTGSHRFVLDYLLEEVLQRQTNPVQVFLLQTSILERLNGDLCDAVLRAPAGSGDETLQTIDRNNLFIIPLDNERLWYRYHHLFRDLLRKRLGQNLTPEGIAGLHLRASNWYENNNRMLEAFCQAAAANDIERCVRLMDSSKMPLHLRSTVTTILSWLESLPKTILDERPELWWKQAAMLLILGQQDGVEEKLKATEAAIASTARPDGWPDEPTRDLIGRIAAARANLAQAQVQAEPIFVQARRALEYLHPNNLADRSMVARAMGFAHYINGDLDEAVRSYTVALSLAQKAGAPINSTLALIRLGQIQEEKNQLHRAAETYQQVIKLVDEYSPSNSSSAYLGLARVFYEWNDLNAAEEYGEQSLRLAQQYDQIIDRLILSELFLTGLKLARRDVTGAVQILSQAEQTVRQKNYTYRDKDILAAQVVIHLRQGDVDTAFLLAQQDDVPIMQAHVSIARGEPSAALARLEPVLQEAEDNGWAKAHLTGMAVRAIALNAHGEKDKAIAQLAEVLARAEPEGSVRLFLDGGPRMAELLSVAAAQGIRPKYVNKLLAAFAAEPEEQRPAASVPGRIELVDPLTPRELEVLQLIAAGLSNQDICARLFLALDTVKGHNRRIFEKLHVQRRTEAIARARELGLL